MTRRNLVVDTVHPERLESLIAAYLDALQVRGYSASTLAGRDCVLGVFARWCAELGVTVVRELTPAVIIAYQRMLVRTQPPRTQFGRLQPLRGWCVWLVERGWLDHDPAAGLVMPRLRIPAMPVLTAAEVDRLLAAPDTTTPSGIRDRALLEVMYSVGLRRSEVVRLALYDLLIDRGILTVREGKGRKDRVVPIGERALAWVARYVREVRPIALSRVRGRRLGDTGIVFLTYVGNPLAPDTLGWLTTRYVQAVGLSGAGACHALRRSMATHLLDAGAQVQAIGAILGHDQLSSTARYTQVSPEALAALVARLDEPGAW